MMAEQSHTFADRLRAMLTESGLSQYALAKRSGLSKQSLSALLLGGRDPSWDTVQRLAIALGVDCRAFANPNLTIPNEETAPGPGRPRKELAEPPTETPKRGRGRPRKAEGEAAQKGKGKRGGGT